MARIENDYHQATMTARVFFSYPPPALSLSSKFNNVILCSYKTNHEASVRTTETALSASFKIPSNTIIFTNSTFLHSTIVCGS